MTSLVKKCWSSMKSRRDRQYREEDIPDEFTEESSAARMTLLEKLADFDEEVMEKYLEEQPVSADVIHKAITERNTQVATGTCTLRQRL